MQTRKVPIVLATTILFTLVIPIKTFEPLWVVNVLRNDIQNLDLIISSYFVTWCTLLNLKSNVSVVMLHIFGKPHR